MPPRPKSAYPTKRRIRGARGRRATAGRRPEGGPGATRPTKGPGGRPDEGSGRTAGRRAGTTDPRNDRRTRPERSTATGKSGRAGRPDERPDRSPPQERSGRTARATAGHNNPSNSQTHQPTSRKTCRRSRRPGPPRSCGAFQPHPHGGLTLPYPEKGHKPAAASPCSGHGDAAAGGKRLRDLQRRGNRVRHCGGWLRWSGGPGPPVLRAGVRAGPGSRRSFRTGRHTVLVAALRAVAAGTCRP